VQVPEVYEQMVSAGCTPDDMAKDMLRSAQRFKQRGSKVSKRELYLAKKGLESRYSEWLNFQAGYSPYRY